MRDATSRILLLCVSTGLGLAVAEFAVRVFNLGPEIRPVYRENFRLSENPSLGYELAPESPDGESRINSHGFRGSEVGLRKEAGTRRIAVIGDSISFGHDVTFRQAFSAVMQRNLNRRLAESGVRYEVLNFGVTGYGATQAVESLRSLALAFDPDLVVYAYCLNDAQAYSLEMANLRALATNAERGYLDRFATDRLRVFVLARYGLQLLTRAGRERGEEQFWHSDDPQFIAIRSGGYQGYYEGLYRDPASLQRVIDAFDALAEVSQRESLPVLVVLFPLLIDLDRYTLVDVHQKLRAELESRSLGVLDLTEVYTDQFVEDPAGLAMDPLHPTVRGHRVAALAVLYRLLADGFVDGKNADSFMKIEALSKRGSGLSTRVRRVMEGS